MTGEAHAGAGFGDAASAGKTLRHGVLDPLDRASELLFGLIMVLTFTLSIGTTEAGREDVRAILIGALGCNLAWAIIDAALYLMGAHGERRLAVSALAAIRDEKDPAVGRALVAERLPLEFFAAITEEDLERFRLHLKTVTAEAPRESRRADLLASLGVFLLVFLCLFPVVLPFLVFADVGVALRVSNAIAVVLLFLTGYTFGRHVGRPWKTGLLMVFIGIGLVAVAIALGG